MGEVWKCAGLIAALLGVLGCGQTKDRQTPEPPMDAAPGPESPQPAKPAEPAEPAGPSNGPAVPDPTPQLPACGEITESLRFGISALGTPDPTTYDGPVTVERSTRQDLWLTLGSAELAPRLQLLDFSGAALPLFPVGARLHLTKTPAVEPPSRFLASSNRWAWSLRDHEGGTLLMGSSWGAPSDPAAPVAIRVGGDSCVAPNSSCASADAAIFHQGVEVLADETMLFEEGGVRRITIDGIKYLVEAASTREVGKSCFGDHVATIEPTAWVNVVAEDPESLLENLEIGEPPTCSHGNDSYRVVGFYMERASHYEGPVTYAGVDSNTGEFLFDAPGRGSLSVASPKDLFEEPPTGTEYWVEYFDGMGTLRETENGPLLIAGAGVFPIPFADEVAADLEALLDVPVRAERACDYVEVYPARDEPTALWDLVFETSPRTRIRTNQIATVMLDGQEYSAWFDSSIGLEASFSVFRR
jgi:hypothetical protein